MIERARHRRATATGWTFAVGDLRDWRPTSRRRPGLATRRCSGCPGTSTCCRGWSRRVAPGRLVRLPGPGQLRRAAATRDAPTCATLPRAGGERLDGRDRARTPAVRRAGELPGPAGRASAAGRTRGRRRTCMCCTGGTRLRWISGTGLRPVSAPSTTPSGAGFLAEYRALVAPAYPQRPCGTVLPFRRIFAVAQRAADVAG